MTEKSVEISFKCDVCGTTDHKWFEAYYEEGVKLIKAEKSYITWCKKTQEYVLKNCR